MRARSPQAHNEAQRRYFEETPKPGMVPRASRYLERHVDEIVRAAGLTGKEAILEVGAGMGRYTIPLRNRGYDVEALDLSKELLDRLAEYDLAQPGERRALRRHAADIAEPPRELHGRFDAVVGFFTLHHVHDLEACFRGARRVLRAGGRIAFLEPNPLNPLYYVQIAVTPGMTWQGDGGIVHMRPGVVLPALEASGFSLCRYERFGFFPPCLAERELGSRIERLLERIPPLRPVLLFQIFTGCALRWA